MLRKIFIILAVCILLVSTAGCGTEEKNVSNTTGEKIVVGSKHFAENKILAWAAKFLIEDKTALSVKKQDPVSGAEKVLHPALKNGKIDLYPEYDGTGWVAILGHEEFPENADQTLYEKVKKEYKEKFNIVWLPKLGFENTWTLTTRKETAQKYNLKKFSDLAKHSELTFGCAPAAVDREDHWAGLKKVYHLKNPVKTMNIGLRYKALLSKEVDFIDAYSTDAKLKKFDLVTLKDDKNFFPPYYCGFIVRQDTLNKYPQLKEALEPLYGNITAAEMIKLNYQVSAEHKSPRKVAKNFLMNRGLIKKE